MPRSIGWFDRAAAGKTKPPRAMDPPEPIAREPNPGYLPRGLLSGVMCCGCHTFPGLDRDVAGIGQFSGTVVWGGNGRPLGVVSW